MRSNYNRSIDNAETARPGSIELLKEKEVGVEFLRAKDVMDDQRKVRGGLDVPFIEANNLMTMLGNLSRASKV